MPAKIRPAAVLATLAGVAVAVILVLAGVFASSGAEAASNVSCGDTITTDATLHHNLVSCPNNGIVIGADNVTLDLSYHTIDSDGTPAAGCDPDTEFCDIGVLNDGHDGVTIVHGSVRQFALGAIVGEVRHNHLLDISTSRSRFSGMLIFDSARSVVQNSSAIRNGVHTDQAGISMFSSRRIRILHNSIRDNGDIGLYDENLDRSRLIGNTFSRNPEAGALVNGDGNLVVHNRFRRDGDGVGVGGNDNIVRRNLVAHSTGLGLQVGAGKRNLFARNRVRNTRGLGIDVASYGPVTGTVVRRNRISDAGEDGLAVRSVRKTLKRTQVRRNHVFHSGDDGIDVASASTTLTGNEADRNADLGIAAARGVTDGGANIARHNGDPRQCTHIACH
jgi:parallel beta-helix repeat protein